MDVCDRANVRHGPVNLNHYWTQSRDQFMHVKIRRGGGHSRETLTGNRGSFVRNFSKLDYKGVIDTELKKYLKDTLTLS